MWLTTWTLRLAKICSNACSASSGTPRLYAMNPFKLEPFQVARWTEQGARQSVRRSSVPWQGWQCRRRCTAWRDVAFPVLWQWKRSWTTDSGAAQVILQLFRLIPSGSIVELHVSDPVQ